MCVSLHVCMHKYCIFVGLTTSKYKCMLQIWLRNVKIIIFIGYILIKHFHLYYYIRYHLFEHSLQTVYIAFIWTVVYISFVKNYTSKYFVVQCYLLFDAISTQWNVHTLLFYVFNSYTCFNLIHLCESVSNHFNDANNHHEMILMFVG